MCPAVRLWRPLTTHPQVARHSDPQQADSQVILEVPVAEDRHPEGGDTQDEACVSHQLHRAAPYNTTPQISSVAVAAGAKAVPSPNSTVIGVELDGSHAVQVRVMDGSTTSRHRTTATATGIASTHHPHRSAL